MPTPPSELHNERWACVADFRFRDGSHEYRVLLQDSERRCLMLQRLLGRAVERRCGIVYDGAAVEPPLDVVVAVQREESEREESDA